MRWAMAGAGLTHSTGHGARRSSLAREQRVMRAGEHDVIGAAPLGFDETRRDFLADVGIVDRHALHMGLGESSQALRADEE